MMNRLCSWRMAFVQFGSGDIPGFYGEGHGHAIHRDFATNEAGSRRDWESIEETKT